MKIVLENIGKIKEANIVIEGITVIAGENNTGKSTVGKALFSLFNSFYQIEEKIRQEKETLLEKVLIQKLALDDLEIFWEKKESIQKAIQALLKLSENQITEDLILHEVAELWEKDEKMDVKDIVDILCLSNEYIVKISAQKNLLEVFHERLTNIYTKNKSKIRLEIAEKEIEIDLQENKIERLVRNIGFSTRAIYIDNPFILDDIYTFPYDTIGPSYRRLLIKLLRINREQNMVKSALMQKNIDALMNRLENIFCDGAIVFNNGLQYKLKDGKETLDMKSLSTGLKTFAILKILLENGSLEKNGTIVLDEPEIHLHPEWQLMFAEMIALLQKDLGLHVLLTTHSPYFLRAIEVYAKKYGIQGKCRYYLAQNEENNSFLEDVTNTREKIYQKLHRPFQLLEDEMYER